MKEFVTSLTAAFDVEDCLDDLRLLTTLDRFQASDGICKAADHVAQRLSAFGVSDVQVHHYACPASWWTFEGPTSWTPESAELRTASGGRDLVLRYPAEPMSLATHSAPTAAEGIRAPLEIFRDPGDPGRYKRAVLLVDPAASSIDDAIEGAERADAAGIVLNALGNSMSGARGRIELPARTKLFGFSVTADEFAHLCEAARRGAIAHVVVSLTRTAPMPLVEASIGPKDADAEVIVQAHLCHPRPGANDNCSGVAGVLGFASSLSRLKGTTPFRRLRRSIRFLFGPEFVGTVAYAHDFLRPGKRPPAIAAINLDMIGENQALCGGPLILELPPDHLPSPLGAIAEWCLAALPETSRSYSGAAPVRNWGAAVVPFVGASDHGVYADRSVGVPSMMIGHWPDRFNHTSFDTLDKIDSLELRRAATIGGAAAAILAAAATEHHDELAFIATQQALSRLLAASRMGFRANEAPATAAASRADMIAALAECGRKNIAAVEKLTGRKSRWGRKAVDQQEAVLQTLLGARSRKVPSRRRHGAIKRLWPGPFNVRRLLELATGTHANRVRQRLSADKGGYATVLALALAIDDRSSRIDIIRRAACNSMLDIDRRFADDVFDTIIEVGWGREVL